MSNIKTDIEAFMAEHNMSATAFGDGALSDRHLVHELRRVPPRRLWPETEARIRKFMSDYPAK